MERPFHLTDLFCLLEEKHEMDNRQLAMTVLEELCESGVVRYGDFGNGWMFQTVRDEAGQTWF